MKKAIISLKFKKIYGCVETRDLVNKSNTNEYNYTYFNNIFSWRFTCLAQLPACPNPLFINLPPPLILTHTRDGGLHFENPNPHFLLNLATLSPPHFREQEGLNKNLASPSPSSPLNQPPTFLSPLPASSHTQTH